MIRSFLIASVVLVHSAICYAQSMLPVQQDTTLFLHSNEVIFSGVADYQSTSVGKDITKSFFYGGFIDDEMKGASSGRQQLVNRFGIDINTEIEYRNHKRALFKDSTIGYLFKYGFYNFSGIQYTEDVFDLLFFGNSSFIGDTAFLTLQLMQLVCIIHCQVS